MKKDKWVNTFWGKLVSVLFALMLVVVGACLLPTEGREALAGSTDSSAVYVKNLDIADYTTNDADSKIVRTAPKPDATSDYKDWIFAGWYTDQACTTTVSETTVSGSYWAKFVPSEVLSVKCQVSVDTDEKSEKGKLRIVSTVDSLKYSKVGFDITFKGKTIPYSTSKVYTKIEAAAKGVEYGFSPNIFDLQSEYFITATLININNEDFGEGVLVKPYWVTKDGTKVYGMSRYARVEDSYLNIVNVPVRLYSDTSVNSSEVTVQYDATMLKYEETYSSTLLAGATSTNGYDAGYVFDQISVVKQEDGTIKVTGTSDADKSADGMLVNLRLKIQDNVTLPKINSFTVTTDSGVVAPDVIYKYFKVGSYTGKADTQWYDTNTTAAEYVITTPEELYGFASLVGDGKIATQTVYLGADITINSNWTAGPTAPSYPWTPIKVFKGTLDGQEHSIDGVYVNDETNAQDGVGLFKQVNGTVQNLNLKNSYIASDGLMTGSIAGYLAGNLTAVSSDAIVVNTSTSTGKRDKECGGLVGRFGSAYERTISNCWFGGTVTSPYRDLGGIVGRVAMGNKTIEHCLNTGVVISNFTEGTWAGGLVGSVDAQDTEKPVTLTLKDSLNKGDVVSTYSVWQTGAVIGRVTKGDTVTIENSYATNESYTNPDGKPQAIGGVADNVSTNGDVTLCAESLLTGYTGYLKADLDYYTDHNKKNGGYWVITADGTPELKSFADTWADVGWYFDDDDITTYEINTIEELYGLAALSTHYNFEGEIIKLTSDIILNEGHAADWGSVAPKCVWTPIGTQAFAGTFDGQGHKISGIYVNSTSTKIGLFAETTVKSTIKNLRLENSYISSNTDIIGSVAGRGNGTLDTIYSDAIVVSSGTAVGGIVGQVNKDTAITNCWFNGQVNQEKNGTDVAGLLGTTSGTLTLTIDNCLNTGEIYGNKNVGGIIGQARNGATLIANSCLNVKEVNGYTNKGNILGLNAGTAKVANCYSLEDSAIAINNATTGQLTESNNSTYADTAIQGDGAHALIGLDYTNYWIAKTDSTPELKSFSSNKNNLTPSGTQVYTGWYNSWDEKYTITTAAGLRGLSEISQSNSFANKTIQLGADITLNEGELDPKGSQDDWNTTLNKWDQWTPIGPDSGTAIFAGSFDGQGHTIRGIYVKDATSYSGLFARTTSAAKVKNLRLEDSYIQGDSDFVGSIAGRGNGEFNTIYSDAIVKSAKTNVGGLVGQINEGATVTNSWFNGNLTGQNSIGGIAGKVTNPSPVAVDNCLNTGKVHCGNATNVKMGGLIGEVGQDGIVTIRNSLVLNEVVETEKVANAGTVVGYNANTVTCNYVYATKHEKRSPVGYGTAQEILLFDSNNVIKDSGAYVMEGLDYTNYWVAKEGATPELKSFTSNTGNLSEPDTQVYTGWYDGGQGTYTITTAAGLRGLSKLSETYDFADSTIQLGADITLNEGIIDPKGDLSDLAPWTSIGKKIAFAGTFDGKGHTISGLYISEDTDNIGLFAQTTRTATVQELCLKNSYIDANSKSNVGSIAGTGLGTFKGIYSNATINEPKWYAGGIVGYVNSGTQNTIENCWYDGSIQLQTVGTYSGGIVGTVDKSGTKLTIRNCLNSGVINGGKTQAEASYLSTGGICGSAYASANLDIENCLNTGTFTTTHVNAVGLAVGYIQKEDSTVNITNVYAETNEILKGVGYGTANGAVTEVDREKLLGDNAKTNASELFADGTTWTIVIDSTPVLKEFAEDVKVVADTSWYDASKKTFTITTAAELFGLSKLSKTTTFEDKTIKLGADITTNVGEVADWATEAPLNKWTPIVGFSGTFDGQGHTISGLYISEGTDNIGLFANTTENAKVQDLCLKNSYIDANTTASNVGSIAGTGLGTFESIYSNATINEPKWYAGGIVGYVNSGTQNTIENCWYDGNIQLQTVGSYSGGIVGTVENSGTTLTIRNCLNSGAINGGKTGTSYLSIGGMCGSAYASANLDIENCLNTGDLTTSNVNGVGLAVGYIQKADSTVNITNAYAKMNDSLDSVGYSAATVNGAIVEQEDILGANAFEMKGLDFTTYWVAKEDTTPELKNFTSNTGNLSAPGTQSYIGWYDGSGDYTITTAAGLYGFSELSQTNSFEGSTIRLGADIKVNDGESAEWSSTSGPTNVFTPIAYNNNSGFLGEFDGQGHTVSGIYIVGSKQGTGLFYWTGESTTIKNLRLENSYIYSANHNVGSIAGYGGGTYDNIYSNAIVEAGDSNYYIGGILGAAYRNLKTNVSNCWFAGSVKLGANGYYAGGIVGAATAGSTLTMSNCLMSGKITGSKTGEIYVGGLCGTAYGGTIKLSNSLYVGSMILDADATYQDSAIGAIDNNGTASIVHTYVNARVQETGVGFGTPTGSVTLVDEEAIKGEGAFTMTGLDFTDKWAAVEGKTPELALFSTAERKLPDGSWTYEGWYDGGQGTYTITTAAGLRGLSKLSETYDFAESTIQLGADITLNKGTIDPKGDLSNLETDIEGWEKWTPIGKTKAFAGTFDGQGHTISGLYVNADSANVGLFGKATTESVIQNMQLENSYICSEKTHVGSIVGYGDGDVKDVYSSAVVESSNYYVGGIVGYTKNQVGTKQIANCWFDGNIILTSDNGYYAGGILGTVENASTTITIVNCLNSGKISWERTKSQVVIGGLCGAAYSQGNVVIKTSLQAGEMNLPENGSTDGVGLAVGYIHKTESAVNITDTYTEMNETLNGVGYGTADGDVTEVDRENLLGDNATTNVAALFTDGTTWTSISNGIPVLTEFKECAVVESDETLLGVPVSRYRIVISEDATILNELMAGYLQKTITTQTGFTLEVVSDATTSSDYEIVLGNTTRSVSEQLYADGEYKNTNYSYAMKNEGNSISVGYSDTPALLDAFKKLSDVIAKDDSTSIDNTFEYNKSDIEKAEDSYIRVMSSNLLGLDYEKYKIPYQARAELLAECYLRYKPEFIGWQEAEQKLCYEVYKHIAHEYQMVEFEMTENNWCPILYRKDLYNLEKADYYRLDSKHYCEWALYSSKSNPEKQFIHMNLHYNVTESTALEQAVIVNKIIKTLMTKYPDVPMAITGDYNYTASEAVFKTMMRGIDQKVQSGSQIIGNDDSKYYTWHTLGNTTLSETYVSSTISQRGPIDHVSITTKLLTAKAYKIIHDPLMCWASDHYPLVLDVLAQ